jgi:hypothetical protein
VETDRVTSVVKHQLLLPWGGVAEKYSVDVWDRFALFEHRISLVVETPSAKVSPQLSSGLYGLPEECGRSNCTTRITLLA